MVNDEKQIKRSYNMSMIKSANTKIEVLVRHWLFTHGYRYRINDKRYPENLISYCLDIRLQFLCMVAFGIIIITVK